LTTGTDPPLVAGSIDPRRPGSAIRAFKRCSDWSGTVTPKLSTPYRLSAQFPDYADARVFHDALVRANPERLLWGTDWPHPQIAARVMPDDGHLIDLFQQWTPGRLFAG
jgi:predicted TIM-barrel fold metal-dependent hydrolase